MSTQDDAVHAATYDELLESLWDAEAYAARCKAERDRLRTGLVQLAAAIETAWTGTWPASLRAAVNQANRLCDGWED